MKRPDPQCLNNDGRDIEPEKFQITRRELISRFGGLTWIANVGSPSIFGFWKGKHGEYQENNDLFIIYADRLEEHKRFFKQFKEILRKDSNKKRFLSL